MNILLNHYNRAIKRNGKMCTTTNAIGSIKCLFKELNDSTRGIDTKLIITVAQLNQGDLIDSNGIKYMIITKNEPINDVYTSYIIRECPYTIKLNNKTLYMFTDKQVFDLGNPISGGVGIIPTNKIYVSVQDTDDTNYLKEMSTFTKFGTVWQITGIDRTINGIITYTCEFSSTSVDPVIPDHVYKLTVTSENISLNIGTTSQIIATVTDNDYKVSSPVITYTSSDTSIATVSSTGLVTVVAAGNCSITVSFSKTYIVTVNVSVATAHNYVVTVNPTTVSINKNSTSQITTSVTDKGVSVSNPTLTYTSDNISIASVNASGLITGVDVGACNINVDFTGEDLKIYTTIISTTITALAPAHEYVLSAKVATINIETNEHKSAYISVTDKGVAISNPKIAYTSDNPLVATVDEYGCVWGVGEGTCNIIGSFIGADGITYTFNIPTTITVPYEPPKVTHSYKVSASPTTISISKGATSQITANYTDNDVIIPDSDMTYESSSAVATVNETGLVTGVNGGTCNITVSHEDSSQYDGDGNWKKYTAIVPVTVTVITTSHNYVLTQRMPLTSYFKGASGYNNGADIKVTDNGVDVTDISKLNWRVLKADKTPLEEIYYKTNEKKGCKGKEFEYAIKIAGSFIINTQLLDETGNVIIEKNTNITSSRLPDN